MKKSSKLIILLSLVIVVIVGGIATMYLVSDKTDDTQVYTEKVNNGIELYNKGSYEEAIKVFEEVIKNEPKNKEAYKNLGYSYINIGRNDLALNTWRTAFSMTGDEEFNLLISSFLGEQPRTTDNIEVAAPVDNSKKSSENKGINTEIMTRFAENTFEKYVSQYGAASVKNEQGKVIVTHIRFKGKFEYSNDPNGESKIGPDGKPKSNAIPDAIIIDDVTELFKGSNTGITFDELSNFGIVGLQKEGSGDNTSIKFKYKGCTYTIACDANGNITKLDAQNRIVPEQKAVEGAKRRFSVDVVSASTGKHVTGTFHFAIAKAETVKSSNSSILRSSDAIFFETNITNGVVNLELANGKYVVCVYPQSDPSNFRRYNWEITNSTKDADLKIVVTSKLAAGQIIIVLKWGDYPRDLDSHVVGNGEHIFFEHKNSSIGNLDVDCTQGNGIETITLKNSNGIYRYYVNNYSKEEPMGQRSNAIVEVYTANNSTPQVFRIPSNIVNIWEVFEIRNGEIRVINSEASAIN